MLEFATSTIPIEDQQRHSPRSPLVLQGDQLPDSFAAATHLIKQQVRWAFEQEIAQKQLHYHNFEHVKGVQRRAARLFQAIRPAWEAELAKQSTCDPVEYLHRIELLLDLSAISHDLIQEFLPQPNPHTPRRRESGVSEQATIRQLATWVSQLNAQIQAATPNSPAQFWENEIALLTEAIAATTCIFDPTDQSIFQPDLYRSNKPISILSRILALADIGTLGMEGVEAFNREGSLLFLEENPDFCALITGGTADPSLDTIDPDLRENIRQRLLRRARFQIHFAKSRIARYPLEVIGLPELAIPVVTEVVFQHLNTDTLILLQQTTPTAKDTALETLLTFFQYR